MPVPGSLARRLTPPPSVAAALFALAVTAVHAQRVQPQPVTDSATQASPLTPVPRAPVSDASTQASPVPPPPRGGPAIASHTAISLALGEDIDSGKLKQGQNVAANLSTPVAVRGGSALPAGTPVVVNVIATVPAGRIMAQGEFSLQVLRVGDVPVYTDTLVFDGKPGHQDLPDSAPALGTDAGLSKGAALTFHVLSPPVAADGAPSVRDRGPGSVSGVSSGGPPPASSMQNTYAGAGTAGSNSTPAKGQPALSPGDTTTNQQTQHTGQPGVAPNQPQSPVQNAPTAPRPQ